MPSIIFQKVCFSYSSPFAEVFTDLDLLIDCRWRTGLVGRNGVGKSTLLRLICGELAPQSGHIERPAPVKLFPPSAVDRRSALRDVVREAIMPFRAMTLEMEQLLDHGDEQSVTRYSQIQESFQLLGGYEIDANIEAEFDQLKLPRSLLSRRFHTLSGGEQTRALIAALFSSQQVFPLIDEPTNHLDAVGRKQLSRYLQQKPGFLLVSHDRAFLDETIDHVVSVNRADVRLSRGNFSTWARDMDDELAHESRTRDKIEREVKQLKKAALHRRQSAQSREGDKYGSDGEGVRDSGYIGHRAAKQMKRALTAERRIDDRLAQKQSLLRNQEKERELRVATTTGINGPLVAVQNLEARLNGAHVLFSQVSLQLSCGDRLVLMGANGSGKSTLLDIVCGDREPDSGLVIRLPGLTIGRVHQHPRWSEGLLRDHLAEAPMDETRFRQLLGVLGVSGEIFERDLATFSEGQRKKVELVRALLEPVDLFVWDEPLNYIDLMARKQLEQAIVQHQPTMLFVEHDLHFVDQVATDRLSLDRSPQMAPR